jgi:hypothetical protein
LKLHADLGRVYKLLVSGMPVTSEDNLQPGARVLITTGSFAGLEGTLLRRDNQLRFVVEVELLQRGVSLEVDDWMFRPLDPPKSEKHRDRMAGVGPVGSGVTPVSSRSPFDGGH